MDLSEQQLDEYLSMYNLLKKEDLQECAALADNRRTFEFMTSSLQEDRESEMLHGIRHVLTQPLVHVLSAKVKSKKDGQLAIYGEIYAKHYDRGYLVKHELFKCEKDAPQIVGTGGVLPLKGPDFSCKLDYGCMPLNCSLVMKLFDQAGENFADKRFELNEVIDYYKDYEVVRSMELGALTLRYIIIPHGISCRMKIKVWPRHSLDSFDVGGRIAVKYDNPPFLEECVLFNKQERVITDVWKLNLSRCWLALSAYSALVVDVDLSIIGTDKKIVGTAKMFPDNGWGSSDTIVVEDYIVMVEAAWCLPKFFPFPIKQEKLSPPLLSPSPALEIFSVFIGFGQITEAEVARVYGSIEVLVDGYTICSIFKKDDKNALKIVPNRDSIPLLDGSRVFGNHMRLEMKVDVKDVDSSLAIKGNMRWDAEKLDTGSWYGKILCSIIRGQSGFVALHYAIFPKAVEAEIKVELALRLLDTRWGGIFWTLIAEYSCFKYSSDYNRKYHPIVLFQDFIDVPLAGCWRDTVQLSRSKIVVPSHSSLVLVLGYKVSEGDDEEVRRVCKIGIGEGSKKVEAASSKLLGTAQIGIEWKKSKRYLL